VEKNSYYYLLTDIASFAKKELIKNLTVDDSEETIHKLQNSLISELSSLYSNLSSLAISKKNSSSFSSSSSSSSSSSLSNNSANFTFGNSSSSSDSSSFSSSSSSKKTQPSYTSDNFTYADLIDSWRLLAQPDRIAKLHPLTASLENSPYDEYISLMHMCNDMAHLCLSFSLAKHGEVPSLNIIQNPSSHLNNNLKY
jgi:hypothetical protein